LQAAVYVALGTAFGWIGLALFAGQSAVAIFLALTIDYTQHYGVVRRETASGRLERLRADHAWTSDHASNRSTFNLGLHADHHMKPTQGYSQLVNDDGALQAPMGYPGLLLLALVPPLWYRVMNTRLSANFRADANIDQGEDQQRNSGQGDSCATEIGFHRQPGNARSTSGAESSKK